MKICSRCGIEKQETEYYASQLRTWCKVCMKEYTRDIKRNDPKRARKWRQDSAKRYYVRHRNEILEHIKKYRNENPMRGWAHHKVSKAILYGRLIRPNKCEKCGATEYIQGAHPNHNYHEPLKVKWLCVKCHREMDGTKLEYRKVI
jgi:formylmethanofuran dehydrogenase subunit E